MVILEVEAEVEMMSSQLYARSYVFGIHTSLEDCLYIH